MFEGIEMLVPKIRSSMKIKAKLKEIAIAFAIIIGVLLSFLIGLYKKIYTPNGSLHISRVIIGISLIVHGDFRGDEWQYYVPNEGKIRRGMPITPAKEAIKDIEVLGEMHRYTPALAALKGFRVGEVKIKHNPRKRGKSKYGFTRLFYSYLKNNWNLFERARIVTLA